MHRERHLVRFEVCQPLLWTELVGRPQLDINKIIAFCGHELRRNFCWWQAWHDPFYPILQIFDSSVINSDLERNPISEANGRAIEIGHSIRALIGTSDSL